MLNVSASEGLGGQSIDMSRRARVAFEYRFARIVLQDDRCIRAASPLGKGGSVLRTLGATRKRSASRALVMLCVAITVLGLAGPAQAACQPTPLRSNNGVSYQVGWWRSPGQATTGTYTLMSEYDPWVLYGSSGGYRHHSVAYIGLFKPGSPTYYGITGWWVELPSPSGQRVRRDLTEFRDVYGFSRQFWGDVNGNPFPAAAGTPAYRSVYYNPE